VSAEPLPPLKITFVGASYLFVHRVARDFLLTGRFENAHLVVLDIDPKPLRIVTDLIKRMINQVGSKMTVEGTLDRQAALKDADFVVLSISVGHPEAYENDVRICKKYGIWHIIGDTIGPAALSRNLRVVPVVLDLARDMERLCPNAWLLNFTNPMSVLTAAVNRCTKIRCIGICHGTRGTLDWIARAFGTTADRIDYEMAGVNHFAWITKMSIDNRPVDFDELYRVLTQTTERSIDLALPEIEEGHRVQLELMRRFRALPNNSDRHTMEFFPWFLTRQKKWGQAYISERLSVRARMARKRRLEKLLSKWAYGKDPVPDMDKFSGEDAHSIMISLITDDNKPHVVNVLNDGFVPGLPEHACVEVVARIGRNRMHGEPVRLPEPILAFLYPLTIEHDLTLRAAVEGDRRLALQALHFDPLVRDFDAMPQLLDELIEANKKWLPQFAGTKPLTRTAG